MRRPPRPLQVLPLSAAILAFVSCAQERQQAQRPPPSDPPSSPSVALVASPKTKPKPPQPSRKDPDDIEGKRISEVQIRYVGPATVDEARLRDRIGTKAGGRYSNERVDTDIKTLYEAGYVNDMRVLAEPASDGIRVIYEVTPTPSVGPSGFVGNTAFPDERLAKESGLRVGGKLGPDELEVAANKLEDYYRAHGYSQARVEPAFWENGKDVYFRIEEGPKAAP